MTAKILLGVDRTTATLTSDDQFLSRALHARGVQVEAHVWGEPVRAGSAIVIRSTWDYINAPQRFRQWLDELDYCGTVVHNPTSLLRWNMHKGYLVDLAARDVPVVPTRLLPVGSNTDLESVLRDTGWDDVVIKPAIGGTARLSIHLGREGRVRSARHLHNLLPKEDVVVQPWVSSITSEGETSIVAIAGQPLHAVVKRTRRGEWRVQTDFGGSAVRVPLTDELKALAIAALRALDTVPLYARIDMVNVGGEMRLLELELVEPELFFRLAPTTADAMAIHLAPDIHAS